MTKKDYLATLFLKRCNLDVLEGSYIGSFY